MPNIKYKEYTNEETKIYEENVEKIRRCIREGMTFKEASDTIDISDDSLKGFILDDALKITIAEQHFVLGVPLSKVSEFLGVDLNTVQKARLEMLEDIGHNSAEYHKMTQGSNAVGNA